MPTIDLISYCCPKDVHKTYADWRELVDSHKYAFHEVILIRQRCRGIDAGMLDPPARILESEDYPDIFAEFGIDVDDPVMNAASKPDNRYYWKYNCMNQFIALKESTADYIAFTDCDNVMDGDVRGNSWVDRGLGILQEHRDILMVCPSHGAKGDERTKVISQCMFLCERQRFLELDYNTPLPEGVSPGQFHYEFEGMLWRYAQKHGVWRMMLGSPPVIIHKAW